MTFFPLIAAISFCLSASVLAVSRYSVVGTIIVDGKDKAKKNVAVIYDRELKKNFTLKTGDRLPGDASTSVAEIKNKRVRLSGSVSDTLIQEAFQEVATKEKEASVETYPAMPVEEDDPSPEGIQAYDPPSHHGDTDEDRFRSIFLGLQKSEYQKENVVGDLGDVVLDE